VSPNPQDPLVAYVTPTSSPGLTVQSLVVNQSYAYNGIISTLPGASNNSYSDPLFNQKNASGNSTNFQQLQQKEWFSNSDYGGSSAPVQLTYSLGSTVYFNTIKFSILNVPCIVQILNGQGQVLQDATFNIQGGSDLYTTTDWKLITYDSPFGTQSESQSLTLQITRPSAIVVGNANSAQANLAYQVGVKNFSIQLQVLQYTDFDPNRTGNTIVSQNRFGFVETYTTQVDAVSNLFTNNSEFWKCAPQPVKDAVVYVYLQVSNISTGAPQTINRIYLDPLVSGCRLNVYSTNDTPLDAQYVSSYPGIPTTVGQSFQLGNTVSTLDNAVWSPLQRDFVLAKGVYPIPDVNCTYLKLEFTQLVPEFYDLPLDSISRTFYAYPYEVETYYGNLEDSVINGNAITYSSLSNNITGNSNTNQLSSSTFFGVSKNSLNPNTWPSLGGLNNYLLPNTTTPGTNTSSYIVDPTISYKLLNPDGTYNNQRFTEFMTRSFPSTGVHNYNQLTVEQHWQQAYFTGLKIVDLFYESSYDDLRTTPGQFTVSGSYYSDANYIQLGVDQTAYTPWFSTPDAFNSFQLGSLSSDWKSFLPDAQVLLSSEYWGQISRYGGNLLKPNGSYYPSPATVTSGGQLGSSSIVSFSPQGVGQAYGAITSIPTTSQNLVSYYDANFDPVYGLSHWSGSSGAVLSHGVQNVYTPSGTLSGVVNSLTFSGTSSSTVAYNFAIPGIYNASGTQPWQVQFGAAPYGTVGYASYAPTQGIKFYWLLGAMTPGTSGTASSTTNINFYTQFVNPITNSGITGTVVSGSNVTITGGGYNATVLSGTNYTTSIPSNTIQLVVAASGNPVTLYQLGAFANPTQTWYSVQDRSNMRVSGVARIFLPYSNFGTYRASLFGQNLATGNYVELAHKQYGPGQLPINTWMDIQLSSFTTTNYSNFRMQVVESTGLDPLFQLSMISPFYHPVRYEYTTSSGASPTWYPITTGVNNANSAINLPSTASGIKIRATALDSNIFISGLSIVPKYKQNPYYTDISVNYLGSSKTNELEVRTPISQKPYFLTNSQLYPSKFDINQIAPSVIPYSLD